MGAIADLPGLGPASARMLAGIGIESREALARVGPLAAFRALERVGGRRPSLNLLYALVGALDGRRWQEVARDDGLALSLALDGPGRARRRPAEPRSPAAPRARSTEEPPRR